METQTMKVTNVKSDSLPVDLIMEILKQVPVKTLIRFLSVSKLWASTIRSQDFMKLFLNVSLTRQKDLLFLFRQRSMGLDISSVLSQNTHESYSFTNFHLTCHHTQWATVSPSVHGLICYEQSTRLVIYNPCTRRSITLPEIDTWMTPIRYYLGHDPIGNDYKMLCIMKGGKHDLVNEYWVLTVGKDNCWRMIKNNIVPHAPFGQSPSVRQEVCISGVLYYQALYGIKTGIMSFDVRSEKLYPTKGLNSLLSIESSKLTSYEGKLSVIFFKKNVLNLYVLGDAATEEWSKMTFVLPTTIVPFIHRCGKFRTTVTDTGVIVFAPKCLHGSVSSLPCYDMKTKSEKTINIRGIPESTKEYYVKSVSSSMVENLMFL